MSLTPYYEDPVAGIVLYQGDCHDVLPTLDAVDHVITDPPYSAETHSKTWRSAVMAEAGFPKVSAAHKGLGFGALTDCDMADFLEWASANCRRWLLAFSDVEGVARWMNALRDVGLEYVRT